MELKGKRFINTNGKISVVKDTFENITIFEDGSKVDTRILTNPEYYTLMPTGPKKDSYNALKQAPMTDKIDPNSFFKQEYSWANNLREIPIQEHQRPIENESLIIQTDEEFEKEEILRKYKHLADDTQLDKNRQTMNKMLSDEDGYQNQPELYQEKIDRGTSVVQVEPVVASRNNNIQEANPIIALFKKTKMNTDFKFTLDVNKKIPTINSIKMMEESFEFSIIEYLANEITENLLKHPEQIKDKIVEELKKLIEPKVRTKKKAETVKTVAPKKTTSKTKDVEIKNEN